MSDIVFTPAQRQVIDTRGRNILVSAAAGSGKTAVLVQRIIEKIQGQKDADGNYLKEPVDIDRLLVLTFTKAAASEMRERIDRALREAMEKNPEDDNLKRQSMLIYNAQITTIDAFCYYLLKNNFTEVGLEPGFRAADAGEYAILEDEVLEECLDRILEAGDIDYLQEFLDRFSKKDNLDGIRGAVRALYKAADNAPFVEDYLENRRQDYKLADNLEDTPWIKGLVESTHNALKDIKEQINKALDFAEETIPEYVDNVRDDLDQIDRLLSINTYAGYREAFQALAWGKLKPAKGGSKEDKEKFQKKLRDVYKKSTDRYKAWFSLDEETIRERCQANSRIVSAMVDVTLVYHNMLEECKRDRGLITFSDMEHYALKILLTREGDSYIPTAVAREYGESFEEIMVDEYQDSSDIQEMMLKALSPEESGIYNRFIVGDVKQSIYSFRNARPELFMDKYVDYAQDSINKCRIDLTHNYRSRDQVLKAVNAVFAPVMRPDRGGCEYDDSAALKLGADYYPDTECDNKAELLLMHISEDSEYDGKEQEALLIADRIKRLIAEHQVFDKDTRTMRQCRYSDIVILLRSDGGYTDALRHVLEAGGIPAYVTAKAGYYDSEEVVAVLNYLSVIDNPNNDIAMLGTLSSVFGGLSDDELAMLRILNRDSLYESLKMVENTDMTELVNAISDSAVNTLKSKAAGFLEALGHYRDEVPYTPLPDLIREIYNNYCYLDYVTSSPLGEKKKANVLMLLQKAEDFEAREFKGLFHFNRYIKNLKAGKVEDEQAAILSATGNVVRIMTMHSSKGLEFPVCIVSGLGRRFNRNDKRDDILTHTDLGLGMHYIDTARGVKYDDLRRLLIGETIDRDQISEELRILYVALTRAKEKLIMTASIKDEEPKEGTDTSLGFIMMAKGRNNWEGTIDMKLCTEDDLLADDFTEAAIAYNSRREAEELLEETAETDQALVNRISYSYGHDNLRSLYNKTSVSELKIAAIARNLPKDSEEDEIARMFPTERRDRYIPSFIAQEEAEASGARRGTAYHRVMELYDFTTGADSLKQQMEDRISEGSLLREDYNLVNITKITGFINSSLGIRMKRAAELNNLYVEQPFVLGISADRLSEDYPADEMVMIQGIIDAFFIEDGEIVLMDYKTDRVESGRELADRYRTQIDYYEEALQRITGLNVKERLLYSFSLGEIIGV